VVLDTPRPEEEMKKFSLIRKYFTEYSTIGELFLDNQFVCFVLEDKDRMLDNGWDLDRITREKVHGRTAIPTGEYKIEWTFSDRFQKAMPILLNVKGYAGVRIHSGNTPEHTLGCLIPGMKMSTDNVSESKVATMKLWNIIKIAIDNKEQIYINITRKP
jgi:hypothetical protein